MMRFVGGVWRREIGIGDDDALTDDAGGELANGLNCCLSVLAWHGCDVQSGDTAIQPEAGEAGEIRGVAG